MKNYNKINFHNHTFCVFTEVDANIVKDRKVDYKSHSGSRYYFEDNGVYRLSNHWGRAAKCKWRLDGQMPTTSSRDRLGFALWTAFHTDNDVEKLYFISVNYDAKTTAYQHKDTAPHPENALLRTASDSTKIIKLIRNLFATDAWAKYFDDDDIDRLRKIIIEKMISSNKSLQLIKSEILRDLNTKIAD